MSTDLINYSQLPADAEGHIDYQVPDGTFVLRDDDTVFAGPGDHVRGIYAGSAVQLTVD